MGLRSFRLVLLVLSLLLLLFFHLLLPAFNQQFLMLKTVVRVSLIMIPQPRAPSLVRNTKLPLGRRPKKTASPKLPV
jgi:hypothetical protein